VCSPELEGEANPLLDAVMVLMMGLVGGGEDTAVKDVLGFTRRGGGGMRGGRSLEGLSLQEDEREWLTTPYDGMGEDGGVRGSAIEDANSTILEEVVPLGVLPSL